MSAARVCVDCLFANVRRQQFPRSPVASCSKLPTAWPKPRRLYSTQYKASDANATSSRSSTSEQANSAQPTGEPTNASQRNDPGQNKPAATTSVENTRTLALARWSALRQSALQALERQQRELRQKLGEASARINDISGYKEIEALKAEVTRKELELLEARCAAREAKEAYSSALNDRMASSREVNDLLQRKNNWLDSDVVRFTELVRQDHLNESRERDSKIEVTREEEAVERKIGEMMQAILKRYHEEQVWSDKIRSLSTYGTLAITCVNVLVFLLALILVEPWKRRRMVSEVEGRLRDRDEQQSVWLSNQLDTIRQLIQLEPPPREPVRVDAPYSDSIARHMDQADSTRPHITPERIPHEANLSNQEELPDRTVHPLTETTAEPSKQNTQRDVYYSGAIGALLSAALVTSWNALFR